MADDVTFSPAEFQQLPLQYVISAPLMATINAHKMSAMTTLQFVKQLASETQSFEQDYDSVQVDADGNETKSTVTKSMKVPLLALTKVPSLNFDSLSIDFEYTISQVYTDKTQSSFDLGGNITGSKWLSKFVNVGLKGSYSNSRSSENTINKSGTLSVQLHASESPLPEGLSKVINWMVQGLDEQKVVDAGNNANAQPQAGGAQGAGNKPPKPGA